MFYNIFFTYFHKNNPRNIWPVTGKALPLHSLSGSKRASAKQASPAEANESAHAKARRPRPEEKSKKKLPKNLERNEKRITFAKFFRLTKSVGRRGPAKRDGNPRGH